METIESFKSFLNSNPGSSKISDAIVSLDNQMKLLHSEGYYISRINFDNVYCNDKGEFGFSASTYEKIPSENSSMYISSNINLLSYFALGSFVYSEFSADLDDETKLYAISACDYARTSAMNPTFVNDHYSDSIRSSIPQNLVGYYDDVISGNYSYLSDYVKKFDNSSSNKSNTRAATKSYSTPAGRFLSNNDEDGAFVQVFFYPLIGLCLSILSIVVYLLILCL